MKFREIRPKPKKRFKYMCRRNDGVIDDFTIFANIIGEKTDKVIIERFQKYGELDIGWSCITREVFNEHYEKLE